MKKINKNSNDRRGSTPPIDHIVLSLPDLGEARQRYEKLGFNMGAVATHNFGTQNAIIPFANGTFIEPLAIGDAALVEKYHAKGNVFLVRDRAFRFRHANVETGDFDGGFSMFALSGPDAKTSRKKFRRAGLRTGKLTRVKRPGLNIRASFGLDERACDCTIFVCERKQGAPEFDAELTNHPNGARRISRVVLVDEKPADFLKYLETACGRCDVKNCEVKENGSRIDILLANGQISVLTPKSMQSEYGIELETTSFRLGLRPVTYDISVNSLDETALLLVEQGIKARQVGGRIVVANASGQGATLAFVEEDTK